jgi:hypothetical protein
LGNEIFLEEYLAKEGIWKTIKENCYLSCAELFSG